ncbi:MAG: hypothetical protein ACXVJK_04855, partial [Candidatus Aminicenantales bacterium]
MADYRRVVDIWTEGRLPVKPRGRDSRANIEKQIELPNVLFLVAESEGRVVGTVLATHDGRKGWINRLGFSVALGWLAASGAGAVGCASAQPTIVQVQPNYTRKADLVG